MEEEEEEDQFLQLGFQDPFDSESSSLIGVQADSNSDGVGAPAAVFAVAVAVSHFTPRLLEKHWFLNDKDSSPPEPSSLELSSPPEPSSLPEPSPPEPSEHDMEVVLHHMEWLYASGNYDQILMMMIDSHPHQLGTNRNNAASGEMRRILTRLAETRARALVRLNRHSEALEELIHRCDDKNFSMWVIRYKVHLALRQYEDGIRFCIHCLQRKPNLPATWEDLSFALAQIGFPALSNVVLLRAKHLRNLRPGRLAAHFRSALLISSTNDNLPAVDAELALAIGNFRDSPIPTHISLLSGGKSPDMTSFIMQFVLSSPDSSKGTTTTSTSTSTSTDDNCDEDVKLDAMML